MEITEYESVSVSLSPIPIDTRPMNPKLLVSNGDSMYLGKEPEEAYEFYAAAARVETNVAVLAFNAGRVAMDLRRWFDAVDWNRKAIAIKPDFVDALCNLAVSCLWLGLNDAAHVHATKACELAPTFPNAWSALAFACLHRGDNVAAKEMFGKALELNPNFPEAAFNLAALQLMEMDFSAGSPEFYKWRTTERPESFSGFPAPQGNAWKGEALTGKSILLWGEQGIGDQILFSCMIDEICDQAADVWVVVDDRLVSLFTRSFPRAHVVGLKMRIYLDPRPFDFHCPLGALPAYLRRSITDFANGMKGKYLVADPVRVDAMRARFCRGDKLLVGVSWASESRYGFFKSTDLETDWGPVLKYRGLAHFVSLQYGDIRREAIGMMPVPRDITGDDLENWAALIAVCDLVITVSNTTAHMAGALAVDCFTIVPRGAGRLWYWFERPKEIFGTMECLWYPSMLLAAPDRPRDWTKPMELAGEYLKQSVRRKSR